MARFMGEAPLMEKKSFLKTGEAIASFSYREILSGISSLDLFVSGIRSSGFTPTGIITEQPTAASGGADTTANEASVIITNGTVTRDYFSETFGAPLKIFGKLTFSTSASTSAAGVVGSVTATLREVKADTSEDVILAFNAISWFTGSGAYAPITVQGDIAERLIKPGSKLKLTLAVTKSGSTGSVSLVTDGSGITGTNPTKLTLQTKLPL